MSSLRLLDRISSAQFFAIAKLNCHLLKYHKVSTDGSGKCDIHQTENSDDFVLGVVYQVDKIELPKLHRCEGYPNGGYDLKSVTLTLVGSPSIEAITYFAKESSIDSELEPYTWYKTHVLAGAKEYGLDCEYVTKFIDIEAIEDSDYERHEKEMSIYDKK